MRRTLLLIAATLVGCGDIIGLDGYTEGDGSMMGDVTVDTNGGDAKADVKTNDSGPGDAGNDVVVVPCSGGVCIPALPSGWAWAVYSPDSRPPCATGYGTPKDVDEGIDAGPASCGCSCTTKNPTCDPATLTLNEGTNGGCNNGTKNQMDIGDGGCNALAANVAVFGGGAGVSITVSAAPTGGSCTGVTDASVPPSSFEHQGRTCGFSGAADAGGCAGGDLCMPNPAPFSACVSQMGNVACPAGFPNQHFIGTMVNDARGCTPCGCTFDAGSCTNSVSLYTNGTCSAGAQAVPVTGTCDTMVTHATYSNFVYTGTVSNASCTAGTSSPDGGASFSDLTTVCCQ